MILLNCFKKEKAYISFRKWSKLCL